MSVEIKMGQDIVWGTTAAGTVAAQGKILSATKKTGATKVIQEDEDGEPYSAIYHSQEAMVTLEVLADPDATIPESGDLITVVGVTDLFVDDAEEKWTAGQTKKISINAWKSLA